MLAPVLGGLLLDAGEADAAVEMLERALIYRRDPQVEARLLQALSLTQAPERAHTRLRTALIDYAVRPGDELACVAARVLGDIGGEPRGWSAMSHSLQLHGELYGIGRRGRRRIAVRHADGSVLLTANLQPRGGRLRYAFILPDLISPQLLYLTIDDRIVAGCERVLPLDFHWRASCASNDERSEIFGEASYGWAPSLPSILTLVDESGGRRTIRTVGGSFRVRVPRLGERISVWLHLPDGRQTELVDSPVLRGASAIARPRPATKAIAGPDTPRRLPIDIIIPVYEDRAATLRCVHSAIATIDKRRAAVVVVDDASPDAALSADLRELAKQRHITLLRNDSNQGFAASVNRAMRVHPRRDAVLLNSDTVVFGDWLSRLQRAACSDPGIASVSPLADDDSIGGYRLEGSADERVATAQTLDRHLAHAHRGQTRRLPVSVGSCMMIRRRAWEEVGEFDVAVFGTGYGEESDWCMRAHRKGWQHRLAVDVLIHHAGGLSFGERKQLLLRRAHRLINLRYPGYDRYVQRVWQRNPLSEIWRDLDIHRLREIKRPVILIVTLGLPGGVDRFVLERCREHRLRGRLPLVLRPHGRSAEECVLWLGKPRLPHLRFRIPREQRSLLDLLRSLDIERIELHHTLDLRGALLEALLQLGIAYDIYLHDYSWICPRVTLTDATGKYCGEPALRQCEQCVRDNGADLTEPASVALLRRRSRRWFGDAQHVIAPSVDTARRYRRYFPQTPIEVRFPQDEPHDESQGEVQALPAPESGVRVAVLGRIGEHKGLQALLDCAEDARRRRLDLEFLLIGISLADARLMKTQKVFVTGEYREAEVPGLFRREQPHLIWLPSVCPETWSYTLSHAFASGLPVVGFDLGAPAERMRRRRRGYLLPLSATAQQINRTLIGIGQGVDAASLPGAIDCRR